MWSVKATVFLISKTWKQAICPLTGNGYVNGMLYNCENKRLHASTLNLTDNNVEGQKTCISTPLQHSNTKCDLGVHV